jgi:tetratricopeptide (TPR) repeat protein
MWEESIASNRSSLEVQPDYYHAMDFMTYAYLQLGQDAKARAMVEEMRTVFAQRGLGATGFTALAAIPARCPLERGDWAAAAALPITTIGTGQADSLTRFARGLGMARSGDLAGARAEIEALTSLKQGLQKINQSYWVARTDEQIYAVSAWIARAEGDRERAEKLMRAAADGEDGSVKSVQMENRLYPLRELYAEMLLENNKPAEALVQFETGLRETPKRYRALYGAGMAAHASGDRAKASRHLAALVELSKGADGPRPEIAKAKELLAQR